MTNRFDFFSTNVKELIVCERKPIVHELGYFMRFFCENEFKEVGLNKPIMQMNQTLTRIKGSVRGMHFQDGEFAEDKYIICLKGSIFDVAV